MTWANRKLDEQVADRWAHTRVDEEWKLRARCRGENPDLWFPHRDRRYRSDREAATLTAIALELCAQCPVRRECLTYALHLDFRHGIWGGLTERDRTKLTGRAINGR